MKDGLGCMIAGLALEVVRQLIPPAHAMVLRQCGIAHVEAAVLLRQGGVELHTT
jgi:hypothetical protein